MLKTGSPARCVVLALMAAATIPLASCATSGGLSQAQLAYNACTPSYNDKFRGLEREWAFVSGVGSSTNSCFWFWSAATVANATQSALESCRKEYSDCFVYSTSDGNSDWVQKISDNGGSASGGGGSGAKLTDYLNLATGGLALYNALSGNGGGGYTPPASSYGGSGGGASYGGSGGAGCQQYLTLANQCQQRQQSMTSLTPCLTCTPGTGGGQAGAFDECYQNYMGGYYACMAAQ